jgi:hypothetical protein
MIDRKTIANGLAVRYRVNVTTWLAEGVGSAVARLQVRDAKDGQEREYGDAPQPAVRMSLAPPVELQHDILYMKKHNQLAKFRKSARMQPNNSQNTGELG